MTDNIILYPFIKKADFLYTDLDLTPNDITLINNIVITPMLIYFLYKDKFKLSFFFIYIRALLDGVDGYIARKYKKYSKLGEIYDHVSDSIYLGFITLYCLSKINSNKEINNSISYIISIISMIINFDEKFKYVGEKIMGAGGYENTFSTIINLIPLIFMYNSKKIKKLDINMISNLKGYMIEKYNYLRIKNSNTLKKIINIL